uniref:Milk gland protein 10 n=1 Tax=Glossina morsitans morsitans TaxID=37546 RepID=D3TPZ7_GLOMM
MKFLTLFVVAALAFNVVAANYEYAIHENHGDIYVKSIKEYASYVVEFFGRFYELFKNFLYQAYQQFEKYFPTEVKAAIENVFKYWPTFDKLNSPEFFDAIREFFRAFAYAYFPHQFGTFFETTVKCFTDVTEYMCKEFLPTIGRYFEHVPLLKNGLQQWTMYMEKFVPHTRQI